MSDRVKKVAVEIALTVGALAGLLCVIIAIVGVSFGLSPLIFRSDSMSPAIDVGDVAISRSIPAADVAAGDIVSVSRPDGTRITHRVVSIDAHVGNSTTMTLRGDSNNVDDPQPYTVTTVDEILFHIPNLGYVLSWFANPYSWALATLSTLGLLWLAFRPDKLFRKTSSGRHAVSSPVRSRGTAVAAQAVIAAIVVAAAVVGFERTHGTLAALTDSATASGSVSAGRPIVPTGLTCRTQGSSAVLSWQNPAAQQTYSYQLIFAPAVLGQSKTVVVAPSSSNPATFAVTTSFATGLLGLLGFYDVELRSKVGNFLSAGAVTIRVNVLLLSVLCGPGTSSPIAPRAAPDAKIFSSTTPAASTASDPAGSSTSAAPSPSAPEKTTTSVSEPAPTTSVEETPTSAPKVSTAQPVPVADAPSPEGTYIASASDGTLVIEDKEGTEVFRADVNAAGLIWVDDTTLKVTGDDGTVTTVTRGEGTWSASP
ncbi:signal peptidase I [Williamsia limnetica]|uniref:Signal peptidase I n=2 Tax=Williamsia limnetica TaxID=882452 RepID=A0A318RR28_WILLI|nr:signal peptidase I [Williamsia limnetica]